MKLKNKVALITGGRQELGKTIAEAMVKEGASVVICDINPDTLAAATKAHLASDETDCVGQIISPNGGLVF